MTTSASNDPSVCQFCNKRFAKSSTLFKHVCEQKRRYLQKDSKASRIGYDAFNRFFKLSQNNKGDKTYDEFAKSPYYNAFVKFGSYVSNVNPLYPDHYINWVIRSGTKLDHWCKDSLYEKYVLELIHTEQVETALDRSVKHMQDWADENSSQWNHYFKYVSTSRAMFDIKDGKISPWLILNSPTGKQLLNKFDDTQLAAIAAVIDPKVWVRQFKADKDSLDLVRMIVNQGNL